MFLKPAHGPEISYWQLPRTCTFTYISPASNEGWALEKNQPMKEREAGAEIMMRLSEQFFLESERVFIEASKILYLFSSSTRQPKRSKTSGEWT